MNRVPRRFAAGLCATILGLGAPPAALRAAGQTTAALEAGFSHVEYDGFLPSAAASLTPSLSLDRPWASLSARGTALFFESGRSSLQGAVATSLYARLGSAWRAEFAATAGGSRYADVARFWHGLGRGRLHWFRRDGGLWLGGLTGRTSYGDRSRAIFGGEAGAWVTVSGLSLSASASRTGIGDTSWTDLEAFVRWNLAGFTMDAATGARVLSNGAGRGVYAELSVSTAITDRFDLVAAGGRYPTDPVRGSIAGRYATLSIRASLLNTTRPSYRRPVSAPPLASGTDDAPVSAIFIRPVSTGRFQLTVTAPGATRVEIMGDFTNWEPVSLSPVDPARPRDDRWSLTWGLSRGVHRVNVRIDGGPWLVPSGTTPAPDDFGGRVGLFVVEG